MNIKWLDISKVKPKPEDMCCVLLESGNLTIAIWEGLEVENDFWILDNDYQNQKALRWFKVPAYNRYIK